LESEWWSKKQTAPGSDLISCQDSSKGLDIKSATEESLGNNQGDFTTEFRNVAEHPCSAKAATGILHQKAVKKKGMDSFSTEKSPPHNLNKIILTIWLQLKQLQCPSTGTSDQ